MFNLNFNMGSGRARFSHFFALGMLEYIRSVCGSFIPTDLHAFCDPLIEFC